MSIERFFISKNDGLLYRISPSVQAGEVSMTTDISGDLDDILVFQCHDQDEGGLVSKVENEGFVGTGDEVIVSGDDIRGGDILMLACGALYKHRITLSDGDEGTLFAQHFDSETAYLN